MFKKPLSNLKTSAPLRSSDRRKLKQRLVASYSLTPEEGDLLCPEGILSVKFSTHVGGHGVAYLDPESSDPLWFALGKHANVNPTANSNANANDREGELIPTVYTLWKKQDLLPFLSTPAAVVPILVGGADLMIPGGQFPFCLLLIIIHCPPSLPKDALVAIRQYSRKPQPQASSGSDSLPSLPVLSPPLAGKAVLVLHTWKDCLWDMGRKGDGPGDTVLTSTGSADKEEEESEESGEESDEEEEGEEGAAKDGDAASPPPPSEPSDAPSPPSQPQAGGPSSSSVPPSVSTPTIKYTPAEISSLLTLALHQAISSTLKALPPSAFPIPATQFYSNYILPSRPAFPWVVLPPSSSSSGTGTGTTNATAASSSPSKEQSDEPPRVEPEITIKSSTHKSLTAFLKSLEKSSPPLLSLKPAPSNKSDVVITAVNTTHPAVLAHKAFVTVGE
ncbi:hypothetical protein CVT26_002997, partial [Gymnopilus dilepis]